MRIPSCLDDDDDEEDELVENVDGNRELCTNRISCKSEATGKKYFVVIYCFFHCVCVCV